MKEKNYRDITPIDKLPELPPELKPLFISEKDGRILIFAISQDENYTIVWDGKSQYPSGLYYEPKHEEDEYSYQRSKFFTL